MIQTLRAMKRISQIKHKRQDMFYKMRMRGNKKVNIQAEIKKGISLIAPAAANKEKAIAIATKNIAAKMRAKETKMVN